MSNFNEDHEFSRTVFPQWENYLLSQFPDVVKIIDTNDNIEDQNNQIDLKLVFLDKTINCEIKTRKSEYLPYKGIDIVVEKTGNMEYSRVGSGISNNKSDFFCYGWVDHSSKLVNPLIYDTQELKKWISKNSNNLRLQTTYGTETGNGKYHTLFYIVKCNEIEHLLYKQKGLDCFL